MVKITFNNLISLKCFYLSYRSKTLNPVILSLMVLGLINFFSIGCSSIKTPRLLSPSLQFAPFPNEIIPVEEDYEEGSNPLGFITPLNFKAEFEKMGNL